MRESHPYRRVSESENAACNLSVTSLKSHCSVVICNRGGLVASTCRKCVFFLSLRPSWSSVLELLPRARVSRAPSTALYSKWRFLSFLRLTLSFVSLTAPRILKSSQSFSAFSWYLLPLLSDPLLNQLWPSLRSRSSISPFFLSRVGGHIPSTV